MYRKLVECAFELIITGYSKLFFFSKIGTTISGASMFINDDVWVNPFGVDIKEFNVIIVSHPLDSSNFKKSDAKQVKKSSPSTT
jgi:hypothetical protein